MQNILSSEFFDACAAAAGVRHLGSESTECLARLPWEVLGTVAREAQHNGHESVPLIVDYKLAPRVTDLLLEALRIPEEKSGDVILFFTRDLVLASATENVSGAWGSLTRINGIPTIDLSSAVPEAPAPNRTSAGRIRLT